MVERPPARPLAWGRGASPSGPWLSGEASGLVIFFRSGIKKDLLT